MPCPDNGRGDDGRRGWIIGWLIRRIERRAPNGNPTRSHWREREACLHLAFGSVGAKQSLGSIFNNALHSMLLNPGRTAAQRSVARPWLKSRHVRTATSLSASIKLSSVPAPHAGSIAILSLNRPRARNALSRQLLSELSGIVEGLHAEGGKGSTRALILASESDHAFCAGADLKERLDMTPKEYARNTLSQRYRLSLTHI